MGFSTMPNAHVHHPAPLHGSKIISSHYSFNPTLTRFQIGGSSSSSRWNTGWSKSQGRRGSKKTSSPGVSWETRALPDFWNSALTVDWPPLMAVMIQHIEGQRDYVVHKSVWHLSDDTMKNIYTMYIMFTCWGCCFFGSTKDPFYDGEQYRKDGGDGTVHWVYEKQEDIEESARAELLREELIEEIEQKLGGLGELEETAGGSSREEELVK